MAVSVALDVDPGIDDALALLLAFRSPEIRPVLVTRVASNRPLEMTTINPVRYPLTRSGYTDLQQLAPSRRTAVLFAVRGAEEAP